MRILVTAGFGNQAQVVIPKLAAADFDVRVLRATTGRDGEVLDLGAKEVFVGSAADRETMKRALVGVDTVYHIGPTIHPLELEMGMAVLDAVRAVGNIHLIYSSVLHAILSELRQHKIKRDIEEAIVQSGIDYTILQPSDYMLPALFHRAYESGTFEIPFYMGGKQAMVDLHDVADVVVKVAQEREHHFHATYELTSPSTPDGQELAAAACEASGRDLIIVHGEKESSLGQMFGADGRANFPYQYGVVDSVDDWYAKHSFDGNPNVAKWILGREPTTLKQFAEREWKTFSSGRSR